MATAKNDVTGDALKTRHTNSKQFEDNWDLIFGKKKKETTQVEEVKDETSKEDCS